MLETMERIRAAYPGAKRLSVQKAAAFLGIRADEARKRFWFDYKGKIGVEEFALALEIERRVKPDAERRNRG